MRRASRIFVTIIILIAFALGGYYALRTIYADIAFSVPSDYQAVIDPIADELGVNRCAAYATAKVESGFNDKAKSWVGAGGTFQVLPSTFGAVSQRFGLNYSKSQLYDRHANADVAIHLIWYNLSTYGSLEAAARAYNGGGAAAFKSDAQLYAETRHYYRAVRAAFTGFSSNPQYAKSCSGPLVTGQGNRGAVPRAIPTPAESFAPFSAPETPQPQFLDIRGLSRFFTGS